MLVLVVIIVLILVLQTAQVPVACFVIPLAVRHVRDLVVRIVQEVVLVDVRERV